MTKRTEKLKGLARRVRAQLPPVPKIKNKPRIAEKERSQVIVAARMATQTLQARINSLAYAAPEVWGYHLEFVARALDNVGAVLGLTKEGKPLPVPPKTKAKPSKEEARVACLVEDFAKVINTHSLENDSNTPDFILAEYLVECLFAFTRTSRRREKWYGKSLELGK